MRDERPSRRRVEALGQCQTPVPDLNWDRGWRERRYKGREGFDPGLCQRGATVEIGGQRLCALHGGQAALDRLMELEAEARTLRGLEDRFCIPDHPGDSFLGDHPSWRRIRELLDIGDDDGD